MQLGNWFSETLFFKLNSHTGAEWSCTNLKKEPETYTVPKEQVLNQMYSGTLFESEEKMTRTNLVELLTNANETVFTVTYRRKVTEEDIIEILSTVTDEKDFEKRRKELAKQIPEGKQVTTTGFLTKTEERLGRSTIIDLSQAYGKGYRLVDHRTLEEIIIKNVKYSLKK
jgi:hypothetical protein